MKIDISSKGLSKDIMHKNGGYLAFWVNKTKNVSIMFPKCIWKM